MAIIGPRYYADWLSASLSEGMQLSLDGSLELARDNRLTNQYAQEYAEDTPAGFDLSGMPEQPTAGEHVYISTRGTAASPPKAKSMTRQTTSAVSREQASWVASQPIVPGPRPLGRRGPNPPAPRVTLVPASEKGFRGGDYGWTFGYRDAFGRRTTAAAVAWFSLQNGEYPILPLPESHPAGAKKIDIYLTRRNGGAGTLTLQRSLDLDKLRGEESYDLTGPFSRGKKPPRENQSGFGAPPTPRFGRDVRIVPAPFDLEAGTYRFALQLENDRGQSLLSVISREVTVGGQEKRSYKRRPVSPATPAQPAEDATAGPDEKTVTAGGETYILPLGSALQSAQGEYYVVGPNERLGVYDGYVFLIDDNEKLVRFEGRVQARSVEWVQTGRRERRGFLFEVPEIVRRNRGRVRYIPWLQKDGVWYRAYIKKARTGAEQAFGGVANRRGPILHGYTGDEEPEGLHVGLVQTDPPTEDTSVLEAPDPTSAPDVPDKAGAAIPEPGEYLVGVSSVHPGSENGLGEETPMSEPVRVSVGNNQMIRVSTQRTVNILANAEFAEIDASGKPAAWTPANTGTNQPGTYDVTDGVLTLDSVTTTTYPRLDSETIEVSQSDPLTLAGQIAVTRRVSGSGQVQLVERNSAGTAVRISVAGRVDTTGSAPFEARFDSPHPDTATVQVRATMAMGADTQANLTMTVSDLRLIPLPSDVRKYEEVPGGPDNFDPPVTTPLSAGSFSAVGAPKSAAGASVEEVPPFEVVGFEDGLWPSGWTEIAGQYAAGDVIEAPGLHESLAWRVSDNTSGTRTKARQKTFAASDGSSFALRSLVLAESISRQGNANLLRISTNNNTFVATVRLNMGGALELIYDDPGRTTRTRALPRLSAGSLADIEMVIAGGGTNNGLLTVSVGIDGAREVVAQVGGLDYTSRYIDTASVGPNFVSDSRAQFTLRFDQIAVTPRGDILDREAPAPPAGYVPPPVDRPHLSGEPREKDEDGEDMNQLYLFVSPSDVAEETESVIPLFEQPFPVVPGESYTIASLVRHTLFSEESAIISVQLEGEGMPPLEAGKIELTGSAEWSDRYATFDVPETTFQGSYTEARASLYRPAGVYVFQEFLFSAGIHETAAERDARRGYGRATEGEFSVILDSWLEGHELALQAGTHVTGLGVARADDTDATLQATYETSHDAVSFTGTTDDPEALIPEIERYARISGSLAGDGRTSPVIPPGGAYLSVWRALGMLLREDRTEYPGLAVVVNFASVSSYPDEEVDNIGGHQYVTELTESIDRVRDLKIRVFTQEAKEEIENKSLTEPSTLEVPLQSGRVGGKVIRILFRQRPLFGDTAMPVRIRHTEAGPYTFGMWEAEVEEAEVIEVAEMPGPGEVLDESVSAGVGEVVG